MTEGIDGIPVDEELQRLGTEMSMKRVAELPPEERTEEKAYEIVLDSIFQLLAERKMRTGHL